MGKNIVYESAINLQDYKQYTHGQLIYKETLQRTQNEWTYNPIENALHVYAMAGAPSYLLFDMGKAFLGDTIEISAEILNISGARAKLSVDYDYGSGYQNLGFIDTTGLGEYEKVDLKFNIDADCKIRVTFGVWTAHAGEFKMRNMTASLQTLKKSPIPYRKATITNTNHTDGTWSVKSDRKNDPCTIVRNNATSLKITFDEPFVFTGMPFTNLDYYEGSANYLIRASYPSNKDFFVQFYHVSNPTVPVNLDTLTSKMYFSVLFME